MNQHSAIESLLKSYRYFEECLIDQIAFGRFQTQMFVDIDYIWDDTGNLRMDIDDRKMLYRLTFDPLLEIRFNNGLTNYQLEHLDELNWSTNEISRIRLLDDTSVDGKFSFVDIPVHRLQIMWSWSKKQTANDRKADVVFSGLRIAPLSR